MKPKLILPFIAAIALLSGCASDSVTNAQKTVMSAKIGMTALVDMERNNELLLKQRFPAQYPAIHNYANLVRRNGQQWITTADAMIDAYATSKSASDASAMNNAIAVLTAAVSQSAFYVSQINGYLGVTPIATPAPSPVTP